MNTNEMLDRLERAVMLESDDAAIRIHTEYEPQAGPSAKVFPPTYAAPQGARPSFEYVMEQRWGDDDQPVRVVLLDSYQSQANRAELALHREATALGLPQLVLEAEVDGEKHRVSSLEAPHRSRDAYFVFSEQGGRKFDETTVGEALLRATAAKATAFLRYAPYDLLYGVWDSHRDQHLALKFARVYTSEMLGWHVLEGQRAATKGDAFNLTAEDREPRQDWLPDGKKEQVRLSEIGLGQAVANRADQPGGVSVRRITREAVLSLTGLARYEFPLDRGHATLAGRTALAALGLLADRLAFGRAGLHLRSGADLVRTTERIEWVRAGASTDQIELTVEDALALFGSAVERLYAAGIAWSPEPVAVEPNAKLHGAILKVLSRPDGAKAQ